MGWQRWRRQLLEQTRDQVIVFAQGHYGIFHLAEYSMLLGAKLKDVPPGIGTLPEVLARYGLTAHGWTLCRNFSIIRLILMEAPSSASRRGMLALGTQPEEEEETS